MRGLEANAGQALEYAGESLGNVTALVPEIGYELAAAIAQEAYRSGRSIRDVAKEKSGLPEAKLQILLDPARQAGRPNVDDPSSDGPPTR